MKKIKSPTGCVHAVDGGDKMAGFTTLCNHRNYYETAGYWHHWPLTNEKVSCKRCLKLMERDKRETKEKGRSPGPVWKTVEKNVPFCPICWAQGIRNEMRRTKGDVATMFSWQCTSLVCHYAC